MCGVLFGGEMCSSECLQSCTWILLVQVHIGFRATSSTGLQAHNRPVQPVQLAIHQWACNRYVQLATSQQLTLAAMQLVARVL